MSSPSPSSREVDAHEEGEWPLEPAVATPRGSTHWLILLGLWGATALLGVLALVARPDARGFGTHEQLGLSPCRMMDWTGVPCPGCGVTTSVTLAVQGHPWQSFLVQPFGLLTAIALPLLALWALVQHRRGQDLYALLADRHKTWVWATVALMAVAWVYKLILVLG